MTPDEIALEPAERAAIQAEGVDLRHASAFIEALTGSAETAMTFQTYDDAKRGRPLERIRHGSFQSCAAELETLNAAGAGIFVTVNATDLQGRKAENVVAVRAVFADFDEGPPESYALDPSFIVYSKRGPQAYWLLEPGTPLEAFRPAQEQLAAFYGSDPKVKDLPRVMRLPGFFHRKAEPFFVAFEGASLRRYTLEEVLAAHPVRKASRQMRPCGTAESGEPILEGERNATLASLAGTMRRRGISEQAILAALLEENAARCKPPLPEAEVRSVARSIGRYPPARPETQPAPIESDEETTIPADWLRPGDGLASSPLPVARVKTGLATLDKATRGGLPTGSPVLFLGPPDAGKTGAAMTIANAAEEQGFLVIHLAADGGRDSAEYRWGQIAGFDRDKLEERDPEQLAKFRAAFTTRNVYLPDPDELDAKNRPVNTVAHTIEVGRRLSGERPVLLLLDSLQSVRPDDDAHESPRSRVDAVLSHVRRASGISGWLVVATSQTNRASRRHRDESENTDPMTAGLESGAIEHVFDLIVWLYGDAESPDGVKAKPKKNKPGAGRKPGFVLRWDRDRASFTEMDAGELERQTLEAVEKAARERQTALLAIVTTTPGLATARVIEAARHAGLEARETAFVRDLQELKRQGRIRDVRKGNGWYWHPAGGTLPGTLPGVDDED